MVPPELEEGQGNPFWNRATRNREMKKKKIVKLLMEGHPGPFLNNFPKAEPKRRMNNLV